MFSHQTYPMHGSRLSKRILRENVPNFADMRTRADLDRHTLGGQFDHVRSVYHATRSCFELKQSDLRSQRIGAIHSCNQRDRPPDFECLLGIPQFGGFQLIRWPFLIRCSRSIELEQQPSDRDADQTDHHGKPRHIAHVQSFDRLVHMVTIAPATITIGRIKARTTAVAVFLPANHRHMPGEIL